MFKVQLQVGKLIVSGAKSRDVKGAADATAKLELFNNFS